MSDGSKIRWFLILMILCSLISKYLIVAILMILLFTTLSTKE